MQNNQKNNKYGPAYNINEDLYAVEDHLYVIGDVHGCYEEFKQLVMGILMQDERAQFVLVGDIIDRGPKTWEMLEWAMKNVNRRSSRFKMIMGNHEYMKINYLENYLSGKKEGYYNSLADTSADYYNFRDVLLEHRASDEKIEEICNFFKSLPIFYEVNVKVQQYNGLEKKKHFIIVHSDIRREYLNKDETFKRRVITPKGVWEIRRTGKPNPISSILEDRNYFGHSELKHTIIIHGHTPTVIEDLVIRGAKSGCIDFKQNDINVDCGMVFKDEYYPTTNLAAIRLDDMEEFYLYKYPDSMYRESIDRRNDWYKDLMTGKRKDERIKSPKDRKKQMEESERLMEEALKKLGLSDK